MSVSQALSTFAHVLLDSEFQLHFTLSDYLKYRRTAVTNARGVTNEISIRSCVSSFSAGIARRSDLFSSPSASFVAKHNVDGE